MNRRHFGQLAVAAPWIGSAAHGIAPSERIAVGVVGLGSRGFNLIDDLLAAADCEIVAVCDVDAFHYRDRPWGSGPSYGRRAAQQRIAQRSRDRSRSGTTKVIDAHSDYRELCARQDIDAVVVATPDHWHALCTLTALRNGKDVYCEKPVTHFFAEGQQVYREVARRKAVFQTGSQQRSDDRFRRAVEIVRNGHLGRITRVEVGLPPGYPQPMGDSSVAKAPAELDYDFWCGPSPVLPYMRARHHRWWRGHRAYGGGVLMDWIGHHNDIAHWGLNVDGSGPQRVEAVDWTFPETDVYDTPHQYEIRCEYAGGITTSIASRHEQGTRWIGEQGWLHVTRGKTKASNESWLQAKFPVGNFRLPKSRGHMRNFLSAVKSRESCVAPAETAHRSITPGHLGYVSHALGRALKWDAAAEMVVDDEQANRLLQSVPYRQKWAS